MKNVICVALLIFFCTDTLSSQRTRTRERGGSDQDRRESRYEEDNIKQDLWYGLSLGNLFFFGDFSFSAKFQAGYKPMERVSIGLQTKFYYDFINNVGDDFSIFTYGGGPEVRLKITDSFYAIGEYNIMSLQNLPGRRPPNRISLNFPSAGVGFHQGRGPWTFGAQILFIFSDEARDPFNLNRSVDYWLDFNYNF